MKLKVCPLCFKTMKEHKNTDPTVFSAEAVYKCCSCTAKRLRAHRFFSHAQGHILKPFPCPHCFRGYSNLSLRDHHVNVAHSNAATEDFVCHKCSFVAKYESTLKSHMVTKHNDSKPDEQAKTQTKERPKILCPQCGQYFKWKFFQDKHRKICLGGMGREVSKENKCDECNQDFNSKVGYLNHMRVSHASKLPFGCEKCSERYATQKHLIHHLLRVHEVDKFGKSVSTKISCELCGKMLSSKAKLGNPFEDNPRGRQELRVPVLLQEVLVQFQHERLTRAACTRASCHTAAPCAPLSSDARSSWRITGTKLTGWPLRRGPQPPKNPSHRGRRWRPSSPNYHQPSTTRRPSWHHNTRSSTIRPSTAPCPSSRRPAGSSRSF